MRGVAVGLFHWRWLGAGIAVAVVTVVVLMGGGGGRGEYSADYNLCSLLPAEYRERGSEVFLLKRLRLNFFMYYWFLLRLVFVPLSYLWAVR